MRTNKQIDAIADLWLGGVSKTKAMIAGGYSPRSAQPVASSKNLLEMSIVASRKNLLESFALFCPLGLVDCCILALA